MPSYDVTVVGTVGRDLALRVDALPGPGESVRVLERREQAGGKGAGIAVAAARHGARVALVGVVGSDRDGADVCDQLTSERVDIRHVIHREGAATPLLVDLLNMAGGHGTRHRLAHLPDEAQLTPADLDTVAEPVTDTSALIISLQTPARAAAAAASRAQESGAWVVLDGAPDDPEYRGVLLDLADVVHADVRDAHTLAGRPLWTVEDAAEAARDLLDSGPSLVALGVLDQGDLLAWHDGQVLLPAEMPAADRRAAGVSVTDVPRGIVPTAARPAAEASVADVPVAIVPVGDASAAGAPMPDPADASAVFVATLIVELIRGAPYEVAGHRAAAAARAVPTPGMHP